MNDIILTGPKHCGKTATGKELAYLLSCEFIDIDELITQRTGKTPRQLYNESGASADIFQKAEMESLKDIAPGRKGAEDSEYSECVIATGGGIIDNDEAIGILKKFSAKIVYLSISAAVAWERISALGSDNLPPFLKTDNPQETHRVLHERRDAAYRQLADIIIEAEGKTPKEIAAEIKNNTSF